MAGLLDFFSPDYQPQMNPQMTGLIGMASALGNAYAPQPASRLPLARPNAAYLLAQAAGGYGNGYGAGLSQEALKAQTYGNNLKNYTDAQNYNMTAPYFGQPQVPVPGFGGAAMPQMAAGHASLGGQQVPLPPVAPAPQPQPAAPAMPAAPEGGLFSDQTPGQMTTGADYIANRPPVGAGAPAAVPPQAAAQGAPAGPSQAGTAPNLMDLYKNVPPPILKMRGIDVPPELMAAYFAGVPVGSPAWQNVANATLMKAAGIKPVQGGERAGVPAQYYNMQTGKYEADTSQLPAMTAAAEASARGTASGQYPFKVGETWETQRARVAAEAQIAANNYKLHTGEEPPGHVAAAANPSKMVGEGEPIMSPRGTAVPAPKTQVMGPGQDQIEKQLANSAKTEENWNNVRPSLEQTENRLTALGQVFQQVKSGGLTAQRAELANALRGAGMGGLADTVMTSKDTGAVQNALWLGMQDVLGSLKQINAGTGGRILNSEFNAFLSHAFDPNMDPNALKRSIGQQLGSIYQTRNMIDDYYQIAKPGGWRDANQFQSSYLSHEKNKLEPFVKQATEALGTFKGEAKSAPTQADLEFTAKKYGLSVDEVKRRLGGQINAP